MRSSVICLSLVPAPSKRNSAGLEVGGRLSHQFS